MVLQNICMRWCNARETALPVLYLSLPGMVKRYWWKAGVPKLNVPCSRHCASHQLNYLGFHPKNTKTSVDSSENVGCISEKSSSSNCSFNVYINTNIWTVCRLLMKTLQRALCAFTNVSTCTWAEHIGVFCSTAFPSVSIVRVLDELGILITCRGPVAMKLASLTKPNSLAQNAL